MKKKIICAICVGMISLGIVSTANAVGNYLDNTVSREGQVCIKDETCGPGEKCVKHTGARGICSQSQSTSQAKSRAYIDTKNAQKEPPHQPVKGQGAAYLWEAMTINMTTDTIQKILQGHGLTVKLGCKFTGEGSRNRCSYLGRNLPGLGDNNSARVEFQKKNGLIRYIGTTITTHDPLLTKAHYYSRLIKTVPGGPSNPNCRDTGLSFGCKNIKHPTEPATVTFSVKNDGVLTVNYTLKRIY